MSQIMHIGFPGSLTENSGATIQGEIRIVNVISSASVIWKSRWIRSRMSVPFAEFPTVPFSQGWGLLTFCDTVEL